MTPSYTSAVTTFGLGPLCRLLTPASYLPNKLIRGVESPQDACSLLPCCLFSCGGLQGAIWTRRATKEPQRPSVPAASPANQPLPPPPCDVTPLPRPSGVIPQPSSLHAATPLFTVRAAIVIDMCPTCGLCLCPRSLWPRR